MTILLRPEIPPGEDTDADTCNGACGSGWNQGCAWCGLGNQVAE